MSNKVTASIHFSFKGKHHSPSIELDIDAHMTTAGCLPELYPLIARLNNYDMYSYEYEMMQAEDIQFSQAEGLILDFIENNLLKKDAFESAWHEQSVFNELQEIATAHLNIDDLQEQKKLREALFAAFKLGLSK